MIFVDFSQVIISNLMQSLNQIDDVNEDFLRHMILNSIRSYNRKFSKKYGRIVICCDSKTSECWRREVFPYYKGQRKKGREDSGLDWNMVFGVLNTIKDEIKEFSHYQVIEVERAEADDIIGVLAKYKHMSDGPILIVSGDKDFRQLQIFKNVKQYSPVQKVMMTEPDPRGYLKEHIMRGDKGDGIPNFLSPDNSIVDGIRQKAIMTKKLEVWLDQKPEMFCDDVSLQRYKMNEKLIDLSFTPEDIRANILKEFEKPPQGTRQTLMKYLIHNKMRYLLQRLDEF